MALFSKSYGIGLIWVFLYAELISALKLRQNLWFLINMQKMGKKNIYPHYFLFFVIFSKSLKQKCLIPTKSCLLNGKKPNITKLVDINFLADNVKKSPGYRLCKNVRVKWLFSSNFMKICLFGYFCMQNSFLY